MIIPTDGGLRPRDAKWQPMCDWLTANRFNLNDVPTDALIEVRDDTVGVQLFARAADGRIQPEAPRHIEWQPMVQAPPLILLRLEDS